MRCALWSSGLVAAGLALLLAVAPARAVSHDFALRRAALELCAGRPAAAARVLERAAPDPAGNRQAQEAALLWAQAELLAGNAERAVGLLTTLTASDVAYVRAQAASHLLGLAVANRDTIVTPVGNAIAARWSRLASAYSRREARDAAAAFLLAAQLLRARGANESAIALWRAVPKSAAADVGRLLAAEADLERGAHADASAKLGELVDSSSFDGWLADWAALRSAHARLALDEPDAAIGALERVGRVEHLRSYAALLVAQIAYTQGDLAMAASHLERVRLETWDAALATEAQLLRIQVALDVGRFALAESLATALAVSLPGFEHDSAFPELRIDLDAWHASRTRATLAYLADRDVLRWAPRHMALAPADSVLRLTRAGDGDTLASHVTLLLPYRHEAHPYASEAGLRLGRSELRAARRATESAARILAVARARWHERQRLLERAAAELESHRLALDRLHQAGAGLDTRLQTYRGALRAQEAGWNRTLAARMGCLEAVLRELDRGVRRLEARYPPDRGVRLHADTDAARASLRLAHSWMAAVESLQVELDERVPGRVADVLRRREPDAAALAIAAFLSRVDSLRARTAQLASRLGDADANERRAVATASAEYQSTQHALRVARDALDASADRFAAERKQRGRARGRVFLEAADDAAVTAAFLSAVRADSTAPDATRLSKLEHAARRITRFVDMHPAALRADEMWYRLGETHLQRAALQHRIELARFLESGGDAADVPVPVEDYSAAVHAYRELLERHPRSSRVADAHFHTGFLYSEIGMPEISAEHLRTFLHTTGADDVRRGRAALRLGENYLALGRRHDALAAYEMAAQVEDTRPLGLFKQAWCAYDLDRHDEARAAVRELLEARESRIGSNDLGAEALELLALAFAADHQASEAAVRLDAWERPAYDFAVLRRMAQLFTSRAQYDEAIQAWETLLERHPLHPYAAGAADDLLHLVRLREGEAAAHALAAELAPRFSPRGEWSRAVSNRDVAADLAPAWQSRLVEEDAAAARSDSLTRALAAPAAAAVRMARSLRAAAVFAHRQARGESVQARAHLERAVQLYTQTLDVFPSAPDEPTTWLYLGEAQYELGLWVAAADAYAEASRHAQADTSMQRRAAAHELAALDAGCARDTELLQRYEHAARRFVDGHPHDTRGVDALERVGEMAFAAARYEQAEAAYTDVAARVPQAARAAAALKVVGDTSFLRGRYEEAAQRYTVALAQARVASADSLAASLTVLVPGALYRAARAYENDGDRERAAKGFERVAVEHPGFEYADQALYRAATLRAASGDTASAIADYTRVVSAHRSSSLHPDAMLELAALQEAQGPYVEAARTYRGFADTHPDHAQARAARLRAAELFTTAGATGAADAEYERLLLATPAAADSVLVGDLWMRRARLAAGTAAAAAHYENALRSAGLAAAQKAEAIFQLTERRRPAYEQVVLRQPLAESLQEKKARLEDLLHGYRQTLEIGVEPWHAAASLRLGESLTHLGAALRTSAAPPELGEDDVRAYRQALEEQVLALEERAVEMWTQGLRAARSAQLNDIWRRDLESRLYPMLAHRIPARAEPLFVLQHP